MTEAWQPEHGATTGIVDPGASRDRTTPAKSRFLLVGEAARLRHPDVPGNEPVGSTAEGDNRADPSRGPTVVERPSPAPDATCMQVLFQAEGKVTSVSEGSFEAIVNDLREPDRPPELVAFDLAEVSRPDRPLLVPGAIFYWTIGYEERVRTGQVSRQSLIRFRRLPVWSKRDRDAVRREAAAFGELLGLPRDGGSRLPPDS